MSNLISAKKYYNFPEKPFNQTRIEDDKYKVFMGYFIIVCTDVVIVNPENRSIYLAYRKTKPSDYWWFIGGTRRAGESPEKSAIRCFKRETTLRLDKSRFSLISLNEFIWPNREQKPQDKGSHNLAHTFSVNLNKKELREVSNNLDSNEYYNKKGIREFSRQDLIENNVHQAVIDTYDLLFSD